MITPFSFGEKVIKVSSEPINRLLEAKASERPGRHAVCRKECLRALLDAAKAPSDESVSYQKVNAAEKAQAAQGSSPYQFAVLQVDIPHLLQSDSRNHGGDGEEK